MVPPLVMGENGGLEILPNDPTGLMHPLDVDGVPGTLYPGAPLVSVPNLQVV